MFCDTVKPVFKDNLWPVILVVNERGGSKSFILIGLKFVSQVVIEKAEISDKLFILKRCHIVVASNLCAFMRQW